MLLPSRNFQCPSRPAIYEDLEAYKKLVPEFGLTVDDDLIKLAKETAEMTVATEVIGLMTVHFVAHKSDKIKLRSAIQGVIRHLKKLVAKYRDQEDAKHDPLEIIPQVLVTRVRAALKLK